MSFHRQTITAVKKMADQALDALARGDTLTARRWLKEIQHDTSDAHIAVLDQLSAHQHLMDSLPNMEMAFAQARGEIIDGTYTKGGLV